MARATIESGRCQAKAPEPVGEPSTLLQRLRAAAGPTAAVFIGFDFPIGLPSAYAERTGIRDFSRHLDLFGRDEWRDFYEVAEHPAEIYPHRPFYPRRPGGAKVRHLLDGLGLEAGEDLLRRCERAHSERRAASPIFWTMGPKQVGKAAIIGWRDVLAPALRQAESNVAIWPFGGRLDELLKPGRMVAAETYPAEFYGHLGLEAVSKRNPAQRQRNAGALLEWPAESGVTKSAELTAAIRDGFARPPGGEDRFDAAVGLFGMLNVVLGYRPPGEPSSEEIRKVEGWILGQLPSGLEADRKEVRAAKRARHATYPAEYDPLHDLYDLEYGHDYDLPFWLALAGREDGPVVEWGAGTGRLAAPLSEAGHAVTAVETSGPMIELGLKRASNVKWVHGDMRSTRLKEQFGLAVCAFNSFLCLRSIDGALMFLRNARDHLASGGMLGIEVSAFSPDELSAGPEQRHDFTRSLPDGGRLERLSTTRYNPATQIMHMHLFYELYGADGAMTNKRTHELAIRITGAAELELMLWLTGFEVEEVYGGFEGEPFDERSDHLIVLARKN